MKIFKDTADKIARAEHDLQIVESTIQELQRQRDGQLLDGDIGEIEKLDRQIFDYSRQLQVFRDRIDGLAPRLIEEQAAQRKADREKAIAAAEKILPQRAAAVSAIADWAKHGVPLIEKLQAASKLKNWPDGLERPFASDIDDGRFLRVIARALSGIGDADWNPAHVATIIDDAVAIQIENHRNAIDELKLAPQREPDEVAA
jgi:hypothetical protein